MLLNGPAQWTGTECRIIAFFGQEGLSTIRKLKVNIVFTQPLAQLVGHEGDDLGNMFLFQGVEDNDFVDPVQELRTEALLQLFHNLALHIAVISSRVLYSGETEG
ncbi:hypothetical protein D3C73_1000800 [compost metagenome]